MGTAPRVSTFCLPDITHVTRSPRPSPSVFAYCKRSNTGGGNGLGTRLVPTKETDNARGWSAASRHKQWESCDKGSAFETTNILDRQHVYTVANASSMFSSYRELWGIWHVWLSHLHYQNAHYPTVSRSAYTYHTAKVQSADCSRREIQKFQK